MFSIEALYTNKRFNNLLKMLAKKKTLMDDYEDFKQSVFVDICEYECKTRVNAEKCAQKVAQKMYRERELLFDDEGNSLRYSFDEDRDSWNNDIDGNSSSVLWEDNHRV